MFNTFVLWHGIVSRKAPVPVLAATEYSVIVELAEGLHLSQNSQKARAHKKKARVAAQLHSLPGSAISSYMWMTSGWNRRVDPVI